jgi:radical SAM-linked protein
MEIKAALSEVNTAVIGFRVSGNARFLSHSEIMSVFERACVRAQVPMKYSGGFNPRPRLSLPLPKSVGLEVDEDIACVGLEGQAEAESVAEGLRKELPEGIEVLSVRVVKGRGVPAAEAATYLFPMETKGVREELEGRIGEILARESIEYDRKVDAEGRTRRVQLRPYIKAVKVTDEGVIFECKTGPEGSIRVEEMESLLGIEEERLAGAVRRTNVQWKCN